MRAANDNHPPAASIRFPVEPRLVPPGKAARRLHLTATEFESKAGELIRHGFPSPCPVTGHYDLKAIDTWIDRRSGLVTVTTPHNIGAARDAADVVTARLAGNG